MRGTHSHTLALKPNAWSGPYPRASASSQKITAFRPKAIKERQLGADRRETAGPEPVPEKVVSPPPIPDNESQRLAALHALDILDTAPDIAYDEIAELAARICGCPVGYISFIDDDRRWLKAKYGLPSQISEASRETAVCATTICGTDVLIVPDMTQDRRFDRSAMVVGDPHLPLLLRHAAHY